MTTPFRIVRRAPLRRYTQPRRYTRPRPIRRHPRRNQAEDPAYRAWIITLPCVVCQRYGYRQTTRTEGHHHGPRGLSQKAPDRRLLPICIVHHQSGSTAIHVLGRRFAEYHGIDLEAEIARLNARYDARAEAA